MRESTPARGRPRTITPDRIADAAIGIGLPRLTMVGLASELGVSAKALYAHVAGLDALKQAVAQAIFLRWPLPAFPRSGIDGLQAFLMDFSACMWELVDTHAGIAPYLLRRDMITPAMTDRMTAYQASMAQAFGIPFAQASWLLVTVSYYGVAVADTVLPLPAGTPDASSPASPLAGESDAEYAARVRQLVAMGSRALVVGALATLDQVGAELAAASRHVS